MLRSNGQTLSRSYLRKKQIAFVRDYGNFSLLYFILRVCRHLSLSFSLLHVNIKKENNGKSEVMGKEGMNNKNKMTTIDPDTFSS